MERKKKSTMPDFMRFSEISTVAVRKLSAEEAACQLLFLHRLLGFVLEAVLPHEAKLSSHPVDGSASTKKKSMKKKLVFKSRCSAFRLSSSADFTSELKVTCSLSDDILFWRVSCEQFMTRSHAELWLLMCALAFLFDGREKKLELRESFWKSLFRNVLLELFTYDMSGHKREDIVVCLWQCISVEDVIASLTLRGYDVSSLL